ncbi:hypothetical protein POTOM_052895 [Populus tomentosa]|uniref:Uncharacterized protein n=1 Tax=Populus tomentosa TaxID=118781 RepID=A0A8X8C7P0_POPTO|nr:hypothetical protein POTOM_052895 [Populus tomentosa]
MWGSRRHFYRDETRTEFRNLLVNLGQKNGRWEPPTCIIADGIMSFAIDIAEELTIPIITFRTFSACCTWTYFHLTKLIEEGEVPFQGAGDVDMDKTITCIPGLEGTLRCRDLPGICRRKEANDPLLQFFIKETAAMPRASGLILNTFDRLEASMVSKLGSFFSKIYTLGPLQGLFDTFAKSPSARTSSNDEFAGMARDSVKEGGSSHSNLQKLIEDIKSMSLAGNVSISSVG